MMRNLVIAGYSGYTTIDKVHNFVESFNSVKLNCDDLIICYSGERTEINDYLDNAGCNYQIQQINVQEVSNSAYVHRFAWFSEHIDVKKYDKVVCADIRDVVFQSNPFTWMYSNQRKDLIVCDEGFTHKEEAWNQMALMGAFPKESYSMSDKNVFNVGVIAGNPVEVKWICKEVFKKCATVKHRSHLYKGKYIDVVPDQVAYSILMATICDQRTAQWCDNTDTWCLTVASVSLSTLSYKGVGGKICNPKGLEYCMVHQYDRHINIGLEYSPKGNEFTFDGDSFFKLEVESQKNVPLEELNQISGKKITSKNLI